MAFLKLRKLKSDPDNQMKKLAARGNAARWQGYAARLGLGITLIKNQIKETRPKITIIALLRRNLRYLLFISGEILRAFARKLSIHFEFIHKRDANGHKK